LSGIRAWKVNSPLRFDDAQTIVQVFIKITAPR